MTAAPSERPLLPFLKWAGGKRWFVNRYLETVPVDFKRYIEPFLGSGALFFALRPRRAILSDLNADLVATFATVRDDWKGVVRLLRRYQQEHSAEFYYSMRTSRPRGARTKAAKFIYLNRTCWNGLYRVNRFGEFNVPIGTRQNVVLPSDDFAGCSTLLKRASLVASDFESIIRKGKNGDLIFADPPYVTLHSQNGFLKYNEELFHWNDQIRLRDALRDAKQRGALILATNADTPVVRSLYEGDFTVRSATRASAIASSAERRGVSTELVITSW